MTKPKSLAEWMAERRIGISDVVKSSGLDPKVVEAVIKGRYTTSPQQRQRLAQALNLSPDDIGWSQSVQVDHLYGHGPQFGRSP
jgi:hypothetical protein